MLHKLDLPILGIQAKIYSKCFFGDDLEREHRQISKIITIMDREVKKRGSYRTINTSALRSHINKVSERTILTTRCLTFIFFIVSGSLMIISTIRTRDVLYNSRENIHKFHKTGTEGFIGVAGKYLPPDVVSLVRASPTPETLGDAFRFVRERVNIPCSIVGRLFPKGSAERLTLLGYGKTSVVFAEDAGRAGNAGDSATKIDN